MSWVQIWYTNGYFRLLPMIDVSEFIFAVDGSGLVLPVQDMARELESKYGNVQTETSMIQLKRVQVGPVISLTYPYYCCKHGCRMTPDSLFALAHKGCLIQGPFPDDDEIEEESPGWKEWKKRNL